MQPTGISHLQLNVRPENIGFYRELFTFLGWEIIYDVPEMLAVGGKNRESLWFSAGGKDTPNDYDGPGVNHVGIAVDTQDDVDAAARLLAGMGVPHLFETPRHRPEFSHGPEHTYYQVMFESPDRILWEIVYIGPKG